jgi:hypothetical protein
MKCKVYSYVEGKDKLLIFELNGILKHNGKQKATIASYGEPIGNFYKCPSSQHEKMKRSLAKQRNIL